MLQMHKYVWSQLFIEEAGSVLFVMITKSVKEWSSKRLQNYLTVFNMNIFVGKKEGIIFVTDGQQNILTG